MVVVLPEPFGPRKPCTSPGCTTRSSPSSARVDPNVFTSPTIEIAVGATPESVTDGLAQPFAGDVQTPMSSYMLAPMIFAIASSPRPSSWQKST